MNKNYFTTMTIIMKTYSPIREILLITTTSFAGKQLCKTDANNSQEQRTSAEQLKEACWNGLLSVLLPEIMPASSEDKLYLWEVEIRRSYLWISMGLCTPVPEQQFTLDPYVFMDDTNIT
jgi:hypothetical protein